MKKFMLRISYCLIMGVSVYSSHKDTEKNNYYKSSSGYNSSGSIGGGTHK